MKCNTWGSRHVNGLIRGPCLKIGTDFSIISSGQIAKIESLINNRPRKCLSFRTPIEVASSFVALQGWMGENFLDLLDSFFLCASMSYILSLLNLYFSVLIGIPKVFAVLVLLHRSCSMAFKMKFFSKVLHAFSRRLA